MVECGELAQLEGVVALEVLGADGGEDLGLLDGVDAEVGLEVEVGVEQVGEVARHLGDDGGDGGQDVAEAEVADVRDAGSAAVFLEPVAGDRAAADPGGNVVEVSRTRARRRVSSRSSRPAVADGGEDLGLLDGVDPEVGLEVQVGVEQVGGVARHLGDDGGVQSFRTSSPAGVA